MNQSGTFTVAVITSKQCKCYPTKRKQYIFCNQNSVKPSTNLHICKN